MDEKKYLNGNLTRKLCFGLAWLLNIIGCGWILSLFVMIVDYKELSLEDKRELVSVMACTVFKMVLGFTVIVPIAVVVCEVIAGVKALKGETFQVPGAYHIAKAIIKE